jgi:MYXO-CTERM domain-containing protein
VGVAAPGGDNPNRGLRIVSVANPSSPSLQGQLLNDTRIFGLKIYKNYLLGVSNSIPAEAAILHVWNISSPANPTHVVSTHEGRTIRAYYVETIGDYAFLGQYHGFDDREVGVFDLSALPNVKSPTSVGLSSRSFGGAASGSYLFAGLETRAPTNFEVIDGSHGPTALRLEGYKAGDNGRITSVAISGLTAYLGLKEGSSNLIGVDVSKYLGPDTIAPTVTLHQPVGGAPLSGKIQLRATATDNIRVTKVDFSVGNTHIATAHTQSLTSPFFALWDTSTVADGNHTVTATAWDNAGNSSKSSITVMVANAAGDKLAPTVAFVHPDNNVTVGNAILLSATAEDNFAIARVQFQVDGNNFGAAITTPPYRIAFDTTEISNGSHNVTAIATDTSNNSAQATATFTVDNRPAWYSVFTPKRQVYVSPNGNGNGSSASSPTSLSSAVSNAQPGDLVWLAAGTYSSTPPEITRAGTSDAPIVFRAQPGARAIVPGQWLVRAEWNWIWGLELYGLNMQAAHTRAINNTVRVGTGLTLWNNGPGMIAYGNIIFEDKSTNETMHNIYTQNEYDNYGYKYFVRNVSLESSKNGCSSGSQDCYSFHAYATADTVSGYYLLENVIAHNRFLIGGYGLPTDHVVLRNNYLYQSDMQLGYARPLQAEVRNNYCARSGLMFEWLWGAGEVRHIQKAPTLFYDNTFLTSGTVVTLRTSAYTVNDRSEGTEPFNATDHFDHNAYSTPFRAELEAAGKSSVSTSLDAWRNATAAAGRRFDENSVLTSYPTVAEVAVLPNEYEPERATVVVFNWAKAASVAVDLSEVFTTGPYTVLPVRGLFGTPIASGTLGSSPVSIPTAGAEFAVFVVRGTPKGATQQPPNAVLSCNPMTGMAPLVVSCHCNGSTDPDGTIESCHFALDGGAETAAKHVTYTITTPGTHTVTLRVVDNDGLQDTAQTGISVTETVTNQPPVAQAVATPDSGDAPLTVNFSSTGSYDPEGTFLSFRWDFGDNSPESQEASVVHVYSAPGAYTARLTVTDSGSPPASAVAFVAIQVQAGANLPPDVSQASVSPTTVAPGQTVTFDASNVTDPNGDNITFTWDFGDGDSSHDALVQHSYQSPGVWYVTLTAQDDGTPAIGPAIRQFEVRVTHNQAPLVEEATVTPLSGPAPLTITLDATGCTDPDGDLLSFQWTTTAPDGTVDILNQVTGQQTLSQIGQYSVVLRVEDDAAVPLSTTREFLVHVTSHDSDGGVDPGADSGPETGGSADSGPGLKKGESDDDDGGCSCSVIQTQSSKTALLALALFGLIAVRKRRNR